jgi:phage terminase large subunit-like protein
VWAFDLELDNGEPWVVERHFEAVSADYFAGVPETWDIRPEGNAKTTEWAGMAVYLLEHRRRAAIPWAASSREQAEIGYRQAEVLVLGSPRLRAFMKCQEGYRRIKNMQSGGRIQVFAADDNHADGIIPTDAFLDELHRHKNLRLYRTWRGKLLKRGGQMATFSTAGEPGSEFEEMRERIRQETPIVESRAGSTYCRSEHIALHEFAVPEGGDIEDMQVVKLANPFSGLTVDDLTAKRATPTMTVQHWSRFVCNLPTRSVAAAIQELEFHNAATAERIPAEADVWVGLDVGWRWDTTAFMPFWWRDPQYRLFGPAVIVEPPRDGSSTAPALLKQAFVEMQSRYAISTVVMDTNRAEDLTAWFSDDLGLTVIDRAQTNKPQAEDFERFMEALRQGWLFHAGDAGFRRHALNAVAKLLPDGGAKFARPSETRQGGNQNVRVIDALVAAAMVHSVRCEPPVRLVYTSGSFA